MAGAAAALLVVIGTGVGLWQRNLCSRSIHEVDCGEACDTFLYMDPAFTAKLLETVRPNVTVQVADSQAVLHTAYAAIIEGDFGAFAEALTDDVELSISGFGPMNGHWRGRDEVVEATRKNFALVAGQQPDVESMVAQGDSIAILLRESGVLKSTGEAYSIRFVQWFTFAGGRIRRIEEIAASVWRVGA